MNLFAVKSMERIRNDCDVRSEVLKRSLGPLDLIVLGVGVIIGAGLFAVLPKAAHENAGPAVILSFVVAALGCGFAGMCYTEFATMIPIAGSAYTYAYATMGELTAWIIGWDLVLEYGVAAAAVSVSWSKYLVRLFGVFHVSMPTKFTSSPFEGGIVNLPAIFVVCVISAILIIGVSESAMVSRIIVVLKVTIVLLVIILGCKHVHMSNLTPFIPPNAHEIGDFGHFGLTGVLRAAGVIFFAYIGFDAVSTAAQEAKNPERDMPIGIIGSLLVCTILYVAFAFVLTGIINYRDMTDTAVYDALHAIGYDWLGTAVVIAILAGYTTVILVVLFGQSRVFFSMSRDGLLPPLFSTVHPKFQTPWLSNILMMVFVSLFAGFVPLSSLGNMTSIGTLLAFVIVCVGIIIMRRTNPDAPRPYRTPWVPLVPIVGIVVCVAMMVALDRWTWVRLFVWLCLGLVVYFSYSRSHSNLTAASVGSITPLILD